MRNVFSSFVIFAVVVSTMVFCHGDMAQAAAFHPHAVHSVFNHNGKSKQSHDCHKASMQLPEKVGSGKVVLKNSISAGFAIASEQPAWTSALARTSVIRGPPFDGSPPASSAPIFLTTQRLRI